MVLCVCFKILVSVSVSPLQSSMPRSCVQRILLFLHSESKPESSLSGGFRLAKDCRIFHREFILWNSTKLTFWLVYQCHPLLMQHGVSEAQSLSCRGQVPSPQVPSFNGLFPRSTQLLGPQIHTAAHLESKREGEKRENGILCGKEINLVLI